MRTPEHPADSFAGQVRRELFLSYNSSDRDAVARVQDSLRSRNIPTFYDREDLTPGQPWFDELEAALDRVRGVAVFVGKEGLGSIQKREMQFALVRQAAEEKLGNRFPVIPVLLEGADSETISGFLALNTWVDLRRGLENPRAFEALVAALGQDAPARTAEATVPICPYRALNAFREEDAPLFFGREALSQKLFAQVLDHNLVVTIGRSGSGKSSIAQAGLLPLLRRQKPPADTWEAIVLTPGVKPFHRLAAQLVPLWSPPGREQTDLGTESEKLGNRLASGEVSLAGFIDLALKNLPNTTRLLAIIDQCEELFAPAVPQEQRESFVKQLIEASLQSKLTIVLTLRADFYGHAIRLRELSDAIEAGPINVGEMTRQELRQAIEEPATRTGLRFETGLVDRILDHVEQQPGSLPLLEYALTELWQRREGAQLTHVAYGVIGGVEGAISKRAEMQFEKLTATQKQIALPALSRLVRVSSVGDEGTDTRQIVRLSDLSPDAQAVMRIFAERESRLVVTGRDEASGEQTVEVAHEALIRGWGELKRWIDNDREFLVWYQRLNLFLSEWQRLDENPGALLTGVYLEEARGWLGRRRNDLTEEQRRFIDASSRSVAVSHWWKRTVLAAATVLGLSALVWWSWTRTDVYQVRQLLSEGQALLPSVSSLSVPEWAQSLVYAGHVQEALESVSSVTADRDRVDGLAKVSTALYKIGALEAADQTVAKTLSEIRLNLKGDQDPRLAGLAYALEAAGKWDQAIDLAGQIDNEIVKSEALKKLVRGLTTIGRVDQALALIPRISVDFDRGEALDDVVARLVSEGRSDEALSTVRRFEPRDTYGGSLARITALAGAGHLDEALAAIGATTFYVRADGLIQVAEYLVKAGKGDQVPAVLGRLETMRKGALDTFHPENLANLVRVLLKAGNRKEASQVAREILATAARQKTDWYAVQTLIRIRAVLAEAGLRDEADKAVADALQSALRDLPCRAVETLAKVGREDEALRFARRVQELSNRVECLTIASASLAMAGNRGDARDAAREALRIAREIPNEEGRSQPLALAAAALGHCEEYREARLAAELCHSGTDKLSAYSAILRRYAVHLHPELRKTLTREELLRPLVAR